jgi:hypothetical protein
MGGTALGIAIYSATVAAGARTELRATFGRDHPETRTTGVDV